MMVLTSRSSISRWLCQTLLGAAFLLVCGSVWAQSTTVDTTPPVIEIEEQNLAAADTSQVFTVQIAENGELRDATLYHRRNGQLPYTPALMQPLGTSGLYSVSITTDPDDLRAIEYYIQARDARGNRTVSGFAFDPFSRKLTPASQPAAKPIVEEPAQTEQAPAIRQSEPFYKKRWFQITLGVVAVGALASSLDSGGEDTEVVPVTFTLEP